MPVFDKIKAGDQLYDVRRATGRASWFGGSKWDVWGVRVISVDPETRTAMCSWNTNPPRKYSERDLKKLRWKAPDR